MVEADSECKRGERLEELLDAVESIPANEREDYLAQVCSDMELRREVLSLLSLESESVGYLEHFVETLAPKRPAPPNVTGKRIGVWRLLRPLGRGGMGMVYEAERADGAFTQRAALKLLTSALAGTEAHQRFLAERRILAGLEHPAIARIVDGGVTDDDTPWFAMEYVEGEPIDAYCDRRRLGIRERLKLFLQVCDAVEHAHRRLVVHRDLKPTNVLVTEDGKVKLLDFGIAKLLDAEMTRGAAPPTHTALRLMTPEYASPEQVRGEAVTTASDVYQLGFLLYELLTGHRPYLLERRTASEIERVICEKPPTRLGSAIFREDTVKPFGGVSRLPTPAETSSAATTRGPRRVPQDVAADLVSAETGVAAVCRARRSTPARLRRRLRGDVENIVLKALSKEPERRYGSADRLAQDIHQHLDGLPVTARADTWTYRGRKFLERHAVGAAGAALVLVLAAGVAVFHTVRVQLERDRAQTEAAKAQQMSQFLTGMFRSADPREARGAELTARELLDRGVKEVNRGLAEQPDVQASMVHVLGRTYLELGIFDSAEPLLTRALELRRSRRGPEHPELAEILGDLGLLRYRQGEYELGRGHLESADRIFTATPGGDATAHAEVLGTLGQTYRRLGAHDRGLATLERALAIQRRATGEDSEPVAAALNGLGALLLEIGAYERAEAHFERALAVYEHDLGADRPGVAWALMNLAIIRAHQGKPDGVEGLHRRALSILQTTYGTVHPTVGIALNNLGYFLVESGRADEGVVVLQRAVEVSSKALGSDHPRVAYPLDSLGEAYLTRGRLQEARSAYERSVALREKSLGSDRFDPLLANSLAGLGRIETAQGNPTAAEQFLRRALAIWAQAPEPNPVRLVPVLSDLGGLLVEERRCSDAVPVLPRALRLRSTQQPESSSEVAELENLLATCS